jgi:hypothetical protein
MTQLTRIFGCILVGLILLISVNCACGSSSESADEEKPVPPADTTETPDVPVTFTPVSLGFSGEYSEPEAMTASSYAGPPMSLPVDLAQTDYFTEYSFTAQQEQMLSANAMVVVPAGHHEFHDVYKATSGRERPVFVTVDSMLHVYHLLFDKLLRDLEDERLAAAAEGLASAMSDAAQGQYEQALGTALEDPARRVWAYFSVAEQLISKDAPEIPAPVADLVETELALIAAHAELAPSPIMSIGEEYLEDYSQYVPRGHYSRTALRQRYFKAMMWFGRMNLRLKDAEETRLALLITRLSHIAQVDGEPATATWASIYDPTAFLVGTADDLGIREYTAVIRDVYGESTSLADFTDDALLAKFTAAARELPPPQINSMFVWETEDPEEVTQGFRFMGQRFVLDAYIMQQLVHTKVKQRFMASGLDVLAALGNEEALAILDDIGETSYENYDSQMAKVRGEITSLDIADWGQNVYFAWLHALDAVVQPKGDAYPVFMQTEAWARKDLASALGSWAELRHDTILYAKQTYPMAGMAPPGDPILHYVEPNPLAFARLNALAALTAGGLQARGLLSDEMESHFEWLGKRLAAFQRIAEDELAGRPFDNDDYWLLDGYGGWLEGMVEACADIIDAEEHMITILEDEPAAIVADVLTDLWNERVLEVATGYIYEAYVVTPNGRGGWQVARGGVYSYYEFTWPMANRLTDESWRERLATGGAPPQPEWMESFISE